MNTVRNLVHASVSPTTGGGYVAVADEVAVQVSGDTLETTVGRLRDKILECAQDERVAEISLTTGPRLRLILEIEIGSR